MKKVQDSKWWVHFKNFAYKSKLPDGSEREFIEKLFDALSDKEEKIFPFVLSQEIANKIEKSFNDVQIKETISLTETEYLSTTLKKAVNWANSNGVYNNKLGAFLTNPICMLRASRGDFYKPLFLFCSDYVSKYGIGSEEENLKKSSIRAFHPKLYESIKQSLMDKFID